MKSRQPGVASLDEKRRAEVRASTLPSFRDPVSKRATRLTACPPTLLTIKVLSSMVSLSNFLIADTASFSYLKMSRTATKPSAGPGDCT